MMTARDIFGSDRLSMFEEPIGVTCHREDTDGVTRSGNVSGTVVIGAGLSAGAGSTGYSETGDRVSVVIRRSEWARAFAFSPRFGMRLKIAALGEAVVKVVQESEDEFTMRCTRNMRARDK